MMLSSAAQPVSSASAIALRVAPVDAPPVRCFTWAFRLTAPANSKAPGARLASTSRASPAGRGEPAGSYSVGGSRACLTLANAWQFVNRPQLVI